MAGFKVKTNTGTYKVWMRARYDYIKSEKALIEMIQGVIDHYEHKPGWEGYSKSLQNKLDNGRIFDIASLLGIFNKTIRIEDKKGK